MVNNPCHMFLILFLWCQVGMLVCAGKVPQPPEIPSVLLVLTCWGFLRILPLWEAPWQFSGRPSDSQLCWWEVFVVLIHSITILGPFIILTFLTIPMVLGICRFHVIYFFTHSFHIIPFSCLLFLQYILFIEHACSFFLTLRIVFSVLFSLAESFLIIPIFSKNLF